MDNFINFTTIIYFLEVQKKVSDTFQYVSENRRGHTYDPSSTNPNENIPLEINTILDPLYKDWEYFVYDSNGVRHMEKGLCLCVLEC